MGAQGPKKGDLSKFIEGPVRTDRHNTTRFTNNFVGLFA